MKPISFQIYIFNARSRVSLSYLFHFYCYCRNIVFAWQMNMPQHKVNRDNPLFLSQRNVIFPHANQFVILIYDSIFTERDASTSLPRTFAPEFTPDERSFVQFSRRRTEYLSNGPKVHEAYVYFMTSSVTRLMSVMKISTVSPW